MKMWWNIEYFKTWQMHANDLSCRVLLIQDLQFLLRWILWVGSEKAAPVSRRRFPCDQQSASSHQGFLPGGAASKVDICSWSSYGTPVIYGHAGSCISYQSGQWDSWQFLKLGQQLGHSAYQLFLNGLIVALLIIPLMFVQLNAHHLWVNEIGSSGHHLKRWLKFCRKSDPKMKITSSFYHHYMILYHFITCYINLPRSMP